MLRWQFRRLIEEGRAQRTVAAKRRIYRKGVIDGQFASLQLYLANVAGWVAKLPPPRRRGDAENDKKCVGEQERSHP